MVSVSASVNLPLHHKVQKFSSGTGSSGGPGKRAVRQLWCGVVVILLMIRVCHLDHLPYMLYEQSADILVQLDNE